MLLLLLLFEPRAPKTKASLPPKEGKGEEGVEEGVEEEGEEEGAEKGDSNEEGGVEDAKKKD